MPLFAPQSPSGAEHSVLRVAKDSQRAQQACVSATRARLSGRMCFARHMPDMRSRCELRQG